MPLRSLYLHLLFTRLLPQSVAQTQGIVPRPSFLLPLRRLETWEHILRLWPNSSFFNTLLPDETWVVLEIFTERPAYKVGVVFAAFQPRIKTCTLDGDMTLNFTCERGYASPRPTIRELRALPFNYSSLSCLGKNLIWKETNGGKIELFFFNVEGGKKLFTI